MLLMLLVGVLPALALPRCLPPPPALPASVVATLAALIGSVIGRELFVFGFGYRRLRDVYAARSATVIAVALVLLAHGNHAGNGVLAWVFLGAIAWPAMVWSAVRESGSSLWPLMGAHVALLIAYQFPVVGLAAIGVVGLPAVAASRAWLRRLPFAG
jgi:membrane protease YdiL (CAAX protease family)